MPGGKERELRRRISSVQSTKKITRAMELIAATRVVKAMQRADAARPYSRQITAVIENLAAGGAETSHPLLRQADEVKKVGFIVMAGDRGLAGAYNTNPIRAAERQLQGHRAEGKDYVLFTHITTRIPGREGDDLLGKKGGGGFPYVVGMDAEGRVLSRLSQRSVEGFQKMMDEAKASLELRKQKDLPLEKRLELLAFDLA